MSLTDTTGTFSSGVLIGDSGIPTSSGGLSISSALELQSTDKALTLTRQTSGELAAITTRINGMIAYNRTTNGLVKYDSGEGGFTGNERLFSVASIAISGPEIKAMYGAPKLLIAGGGPGTVILPFKATVYFTNNDGKYIWGGISQIQYGSTVAAGGQNAFSSTIAQELFTEDEPEKALITLSSSFGNLVAPLNTGLYMSNFGRAFFRIFTGSIVIVNIWYNIVSQEA